jgi:hypothetical protein
MPFLELLRKSQFWDYLRMGNQGKSIERWLETKLVRRQQSCGVVSQISSIY